MPDSKIQDVAPDDPTTSRFPDLEELQQEVSRRIQDNKRFLERFLSDDAVEEDQEEAEEDQESPFEEL